MNPHFPFVAIVGLALAKHSLIYHTLDPRLGGILLQGHRGCAKSTLARAFTDLLQIISDNTVPFVEVPLGTTEDRLLGSVNAGHLVEQNQWQLQQGLMVQADGGVLYIALACAHACMCACACVCIKTTSVSRGIQ